MKAQLERVLGQKAVDLSNATASGTQAHTFHAEASDLRLPPGAWPRLLDTKLGNGRPFVKQQVYSEDGSVMYRQEFGSLTLIVFND